MNGETYIDEPRGRAVEDCETYTDERGETWNRPTAEAYAKTCIALRQRDAEVKRLENRLKIEVEEELQMAIEAHPMRSTRTEMKQLREKVAELGLNIEQSSALLAVLRHRLEKQ